MFRKKNSSRLYGGSRAKYNAPSFYAGSRKSQPKKVKISFNFKIFKYVLAALILVYLSYFVLLSDQFKVKEVIVEGNSLLSKEELANYFPKNKNIFLIKTSKVKASYLARYKEIASLEIYRGIPSAMKIVVNEREPKIIWQSGDKKYLVSSDGDVMKEVADPAAFLDLPVVADKRVLPVVVGDPLVSNNFIAFVQNIYHNLYKEANIKPTYFEIDETTFDVNVFTDAGFYVKLNSLRASKKQIDNLKIVLMEKRPDVHEYVDLRIDGWAYYK